MSASPDYLHVKPAHARKRAAAYIATMGPAIQGQGGDIHTFKVACALIRDFALSGADASDLIREWNATCVPPWKDSDLVAKLRGAAKYGRHAPGAKLDGTKPRLATFDTADEALDALVAAVADRAPPDVVGWLVSELEEVVRWTRAPRKGAPDPGRIPRAQRRAALLCAVGAFLASDDRPSGPERVPWILEQAAREHFACEPPRRADRTEMPCSDSAIDARTTPSEREGHSQTRVSTLEDGQRARARRLDATAALPDDPETIITREESVARFRASLSPLEREVFDAPFSDAEAAVAWKIGTTAKTVHSSRTRIRGKARIWGANASESDSGSAERRAGRAAWTSRPWSRDEEIAHLIRSMTVDEAEDLRAGYPASRYRARRAATPLTLPRMAA